MNHQPGLPLRRMAQMHIDMNIVIGTEEAATFRALDQAEGNQHACIFVHSLYVPDELFPAEQARIVRLLVARVDVAPDHIAVRLRAEGLQTLVEQLRTTDAKAHAA